jgi:hypothetical protein
LATTNDPVPCRNVQSLHLQGHRRPVAAHFGVANPVQSNAGEEVYPGYPGVVVREEDGMRVAQSMTWGFLLPPKGMSPTAKPKPSTT